MKDEKHFISTISEKIHVVVLLFLFFSVNFFQMKFETETYKPKLCANNIE